MVLFGGKVPPKNSASSVEYMVKRLSPLIGGREELSGSLDRNGCDALINAYIGLLYSQSATGTLGDPNEGILVLPRLAS